MTHTIEPETRALSVSPKPRRRRRTLLVFCAILFLLGIALPIGLHYTGWLPFLDATSSMHDVSDMKAKIDGLDNRVTDLEGQLSALHDRLQTPSVPAPVPVSPPPTSEAVASGPSNAEMAKLEADFVTLSAGLTAEQALIKQAEVASTQSRETTAMLVAAAVDFMQLHDAALSGHGFEDELHALRGVAKNDVTLQEELGKLEPFAKTGAPTVADLRESLAEREAGASHATQKAEAQEWYERIWVEMKSLVSVRPLHGGEGGSYKAIEDSLMGGDTKAALDDYKSLSIDAQKYLSTWHADLETRDSIDTSLHVLAARFSQLTEPQP